MRDKKISRSHLHTTIASELFIELERRSAENDLPIGRIVDQALRMAWNMPISGTKPDLTQPWGGETPAPAPAHASAKAPVRGQEKIRTKAIRRATAARAKRIAMKRDKK